MDDDQNNQNNQDAPEDTTSQPVASDQTPEPETPETPAPEVSDAANQPAGDEPIDEPTVQDQPEVSESPSETEATEVPDSAVPSTAPEAATEESTPSVAPENSETADAPDSSTQTEPAVATEPGDVAEEEQLSQTPQLKSDIPGAHWYVVHTYSGHEAKVAATLKQRVESQQLQDKVIDILVPTQEKIEIKEGKKNKIKEKIFPGYLLIRMILDDNTWLVVRTTPGITSFVGMGNKPTPLPDAEVASIQRFMSMEAPKFKATFSVGEAVKIVDGPFSEFLGSISDIDNERGKIKVLVSIFGRETPVELDFLQVAKL